MMTLRYSLYTCYPSVSNIIGVNLSLFLVCGRISWNKVKHFDVKQTGNKI